LGADGVALLVSCDFLDRPCVIAVSFDVLQHLRRGG
jgi:hypothetical protein